MAIQPSLAAVVGFEPTGAFTLTDDVKSTPLCPLRYTAIIYQKVFLRFHVEILFFYFLLNFYFAI